MGVASHRLVCWLPDTKFMKKVWEADPFWQILVKDGHTHTQPFKFSMYSCASESWTWNSSMLLQQKWPTTTLAASAREDPGGQGKQSVPLFSTCEEVWRDTYMTWNPSSFMGLTTWLNKALRNLFYQDLLWACGCNRWPLNVSHNLSYFIDTWLHVISSKTSWLRNLACRGIESFFLA